MLLPLTNPRSNVATRAVATCQLPAVAVAMRDALPLEPFDPGFRGQDLATTYFDTADFDLLKARRKGEKYLTLRVRCYSSAGGETYALSAKTESEKWRREISAESAEYLLRGVYSASALDDLLPANLLARLQELAGDKPLTPIVTVCGRRYAVEDDRDRLTLDVDVSTDTGKSLPFGVLEFKSTEADANLAGGITALGLRPLKISKVLWATEV
jgi:hypothetical protein